MHTHLAHIPYTRTYLTHAHAHAHAGGTEGANRKTHWVLEARDDRQVSQCL